MAIERQGDFKNALPGEVDDHPDSGMPRQLRTRGDNEPTLDREAADVAGMTDAGSVYADTDMNQNADDQHDAHHADPGEHV